MGRIDHYRSGGSGRKRSAPGLFNLSPEESGAARLAVGGVRGRSQLPGYVDRYMSGEINEDPMVTHTLPLERINEAFELMHQGQSIRSCYQVF